MPIAIYFHPPALTTATYDEIQRRLREAGAGNPPGRTHHSCFGDPNQLMVYDIWDSQSDFDKFGETLMPILQEMGVDPGQPAVMPIHNIIE